VNYVSKIKLFTAGLLRRRSAIPDDLQVELTNRCDLNCRMCLRIPLQVPARDMTPEVLEAVARNLEGVSDLGFCGWGETLLYPDLPAAIDILQQHAPRLRLRVTTHGRHLHGEIVDPLIARQVYMLSVSLDRLRPGATNGHPGMPQVAANLREFIKRRGSRELPLVVFQITLHRDCMPDVLEVVEFAEEIGAKYVNLIRINTDLLPNVPRPSRHEELHIIKTVKKAADGIRLLSINEPHPAIRLATHHDRLCLKTLNSAYIDVDGNVAPCCRLRSMSFGNLRERPLKDIWQTKPFVDFFDNQQAFCSGCDTFFQNYR